MKEFVEEKKSETTKENKFINFYDLEDKKPEIVIFIQQLLITILN